MNPWLWAILFFCGAVFALYVTMLIADKWLEWLERRARRRRSPFGPVQKWGGNK